MQGGTGQDQGCNGEKQNQNQRRKQEWNTMGRSFATGGVSFYGYMPFLHTRFLSFVLLDMNYNSIS
jgi:hypothetical protein